MDTPLVFGLVAVIILLGFLGSYFSRRTGVPDILLLMFFGLVVGPILHIVSTSDLEPIAPIFASVAITVILFDAGLRMDLVRVLEESPRAILLTALGFVFSVLVTTFFVNFFLGWSLLIGVLLGSILGGTSSAIVIPIIEKANVPNRISTLLSLESVYSDVLVIVFTMGLLQLMVGTGSDGVLTIVRGVFNGFTVGALIGVAGGIFWLKILKNLMGEAYNDILTLGVVLGLYSVSQSLGGSGAISSLVFGLVLGNGSTISRLIKMEWSGQVDRIMRRFHAQISFLMRTFFFVYIGIIISFSSLYYFVLGLLLSFMLLMVRYLAVVGSTIRAPLLSIDRGILTVMMPRGLAAAVLSQLVIAYVPQAQPFSDLAISTIVATVIIATMGGRISKIGIPFSPRKERLEAGKLSRIAVKLRKHHNEYPTVEPREGEHPKDVLFKQCIVKVLVDDEFRREWKKKPKEVKILTRMPESWNLKPDILVESRSGVIAIGTRPSSAGEPTSAKQLALEVHLTVKRYVEKRFSGELRIVLEDFVALKFLKVLYALQRRLDMTEGDRGFKVKIMVLDLNQERLLPVTELVALIIKGRTRKKSPFLSLLVGSQPSETTERIEKRL